jgi:hypothetical protein
MHVVVAITRLLPLVKSHPEVKDVIEALAAANIAYTFKGEGKVDYLTTAEIADGGVPTGDDDLDMILETQDIEALQALS